MQGAGQWATFWTVGSPQMGGDPVRPSASQLQTATTPDSGMQAEGLLASCYYGYLFHDCRAYRADWGPDNQARQSVTWPRLLQKGLGGNGPRSVVPRWPAVPGQALPRLVNTTRLRPELLRAGEPSAPHVSGHPSPTPHAARTSEPNKLRSAMSMTRLALAHPSFPGVLQREDPSSWESGPRDQRTGSPTSDSVTSSMPILYKTGTTNADSQDVRKQAQCPAYEWASMGPWWLPLRHPGTHPSTKTQHRNAQMPTLEGGWLSTSTSWMELFVPQRTYLGVGRLQNSKEKLKSTVDTYPQHLATCPHLQVRSTLGAGS